MEYIILYFAVNLICLIPILYAADKRDVGFSKAMLISFVFSPLIGFLFILCHPTREDVIFHKKMLDAINTKSDKTMQEKE